ncbi:YhbY family RNA-binding protein [Candidatus Woesearchaeota archaeon]|nr:YhbY family RNA-binding protein [Candidatus Woesearchaeota archaeon]
MSSEKKELLVKASALKPIVQIGKNGLTKTVIEEIIKHLKKRKLIKVKLLKSIVSNADKKLLVDELVAKTNSTRLQVVGSVVTLYKK